MRETPNMQDSEALNEANRERINSAEYKMEFSKKIDTLKSIGIFPEFAKKLAEMAMKGSITVAELLGAENYIVFENERLKGKFTELDQQKMDRIIH